MTKGLPTTFEEAELAVLERRAIAGARRYIQALDSGALSPQALELLDSEDVRLLESGVIPPQALKLLSEVRDPWSWFDREDGLKWAKARLKALAVNPLRASFVCGRARDGDAIAREVLREVLIEHKELGKPLPTSLAAYDIEVTHGLRPRRGGPSIYGAILRDLGICCVVAYVCRAFRLPPTRSPASRRHRLSGCYIAARALGEEGKAISESAVVWAWTFAKSTL